MDKANKINIVIADDHHIFLDGLVSLLKEYNHINIVDTALNGNDVLKILDTNSVDLVITDISMEGMDGIKLNAVIKKRYPNVNTLVLSMHNNSEKIARLTRNNVNGYLLKNTEIEELLLAIEKIMGGENYFSNEVMEKYMESMFSRESEKSMIPELSRREIDVLKLIANEHITREIADKLCISQHTVDTHRKNILSKLNIRNTAGLVRYAIKNGLVD
jgi:DNA-binding NarL/FixJ family response regulator